MTIKRKPVWFSILDIALTILFHFSSIELNYGYCPSIRSDFGSTSFVECDIIGMESFHKLDIPLIHLKTSSEKDDQEEKDESDFIIKNKSNTEFDSRSIIDSSSVTLPDPNTISVKHESNPSTSNISQKLISGNPFSFGLIKEENK